MFDKQESKAARRMPTVDGIETAEPASDSAAHREIDDFEARKYRYWSAFTLLVGLAAPVALVVGAVAWLLIAGEAGSPQPDNWTRLLTILELIERSALPLLAISIIAPFAWRASTRGKAWGIYPVPILLLVTIGLLFLL